MCLGIPMRVLRGDEWFAECEAGGVRRTVSLALVGPQVSGTWLLVQQRTAREVLDSAQAEQLALALAGIDAALRGKQDLDAYFPDLPLARTVP